MLEVGVSLALIHYISADDGFSSRANVQTSGRARRTIAVMPGVTRLYGVARLSVRGLMSAVTGRSYMPRASQDPITTQLSVAY